MVQRGLRCSRDFSVGAEVLSRIINVTESREELFWCSEMCGRYFTPVSELTKSDLMFYCIF